MKRDQRAAMRGLTAGACGLSGRCASRGGKEAAREDGYSNTGFVVAAALTERATTGSS